jgi:trehalose-6-phosphate synthase
LSYANVDFLLSHHCQGIPHKLEGYELFLSKYPEWRQKVVLIQVAVPSREDVPEYQKLKKGSILTPGLC